MFFLRREKATKKEVLTEALFADYAAAFRARLARPSLSLTLEGPSDSLYESKVGGTPYLHPYEPWPTNDEGEAYHLLLQVRAKDLHGVRPFPRRGLLQFFSLPCAKHAINEQDKNPLWIRWIDHPVRGLSASYIKNRMPAERPEHFPVGDGLLLKTSVVQTTLSMFDHRFEALFLKGLREHFANMHTYNTLYGFFAAYPFCYEILYNGEPQTGGHRMGGYPWFIASDPRRKVHGRENYDTLLLQLDTDYHAGKPRVVWPDYGAAHFFIHANALRERTFDDVIYEWGCEG